MTAMKDSAALAEFGLTYWAPGPVAGTLWAIDANGSSVVFDVKAHSVVTADSGTAAQRKAAGRAESLALAVRTPGTRVRYQAGAQPIGLEHPLPAHAVTVNRGAFCYGAPRETIEQDHADGQCWAFVPFDRSQRITASHVALAVKVSA